MIIRNGGSLDGSEIVAIIFDKKSSFSVGEIVMFLNYSFWGQQASYIAGTVLCIPLLRTLLRIR